MITSSFDEFETFRQDMRAQGIHAGIQYAGDDAHCTMCDEPWPCPTSKGQQPAITPR